MPWPAAASASRTSTEGGLARRARRGALHEGLLVGQLLGAHALHGFPSVHQLLVPLHGRQRGENVLAVDGLTPRLRVLSAGSSLCAQLTSAETAQSPGESDGETERDQRLREAGGGEFPNSLPIATGEHPDNIRTRSESRGQRRDTKGNPARRRRAAKRQGIRDGVQRG